MALSSVATAYSTIPHEHESANDFPSQNPPLPAALTGEVFASRRAGGFTFSERRYAAGLRLPRHYHECAHLCIVLEGEYWEQYAAAAMRCSPRSLRYLPAGEVHANKFDKDVRCVVVEIDSAVVKRLQECSVVLDRPGEITGFNATWLANRLCHELRQRDEVSAVSLEGLTLELLAAAARSLDGGPAIEAPRWLRKAREIVDARFLAGVSLTDLAAEAGVHAVHLSREFRKRFQCSVGEYMRKRRVEHACQLIANSEMTLAEIAMICGFADQSHFSKTFKRETGLTPAHFRTISAVG